MKRYIHLLMIAMMLFCGAGMSLAADVSASSAANRPGISIGDVESLPQYYGAGMGDQVKIDWKEVLAEYDFDHSITNVEIADTQEFPAFNKIHFYYDSPNGGRVPAMLYMPKKRITPMKPQRSTIEGTYPVMFFMHFHVSDKSMAEIFSTYPGYGIAVMAIDGVFRGEREEKGNDILMPDPYQSAKHMKMQIRDILRGFDVLASWDGIDPGRIGYFGISMGALTGTVATGLDSRVKSVIIADGGADFSLMFDNSDYGSLMRIKKYMTENNMTRDQFVDTFMYVDPLVFAPLLKNRAVMLMNGKTDTTISIPAMDKLHEIITTQRKVVKWYNSGHILPFDKVVGDALKYIKKSL
ncbi:MAG TPA: acetylxylan esterase [bacterium]|nr:acetylxylan esterase [bacterium]